MVEDDTLREGISVFGGGALVLRIRSTLMLATIRIISISPERRGGGFRGGRRVGEG